MTTSELRSLLATEIKELKAGRSSAEQIEAISSLANSINNSLNVEIKFRTLELKFKQAGEVLTLGGLNV